LTLLNGQTLDLDPDPVLVADDKTVGLAIIAGGTAASGNRTTTVFLEGFWNPADPRQGASARLCHRCRVSLERGVDFAIGRRRSTAPRN
jgi:hypothetical protein